MSSHSIAAARHWLEQHTHMPQRQAAALASLAPLLQGDLPRKRTSVIGLGGAPGAGKSTLAGMLCAVLNRHDTPCITLSLDDYYLPRASRIQLAERSHPLFAMRGVPGTHELDRLTADIDRLANGFTGIFKAPAFDKGADDRSENPRRVDIPEPAACILIEGWLIGSPPIDAERLHDPVNRLEAEQDRDRRWRTEVNRQLENYHRELGQRLDLIWYLRAPDWASVLAWRWQQEQERRRMETTGGLSSPAEIADFLATYERLVRHMQRSCRAWADRVIDLDREHCPITPLHT